MNRGDGDGTGGPIISGSGGNRSNGGGVSRPRGGSFWGAGNNPTPVGTPGTKIGSYNRLLAQGVYDGDQIGQFHVSEYELMKENFQLMLPIITTAAMIAYPLASLGMFARVGTSVSIFGQRMSWFYLRNKYTIDLVGTGALDVLPGFPAGIAAWQYILGIGVPSVGYYTYKNY